MVQKKLVFILIDGVGDIAHPKTNMETPLAYADIKNIDSISKHGINGLMDPVEPGLACGSDTAHMSLLGYDPRKHYMGRGAFESIGAGIDMIPGDIAFKSNFAILDKETGIVTSRRADRNFEKPGPILCNALNGLTLPNFPGYSVTVKYATEHRCGVRVSGPGLSNQITGTDPLKDNLPLIHCKPTDNSKEAEFTSRLVNELSDTISEILLKHPYNEERKKEGKPLVNCVLLRGCGCCIDVPSIEKLHGLKSFMIAPTCIIAGLGATLKIDIVKVPGATGDYHTDFNAKGEHFFKTITDKEKNYTFGFLHMKAVDDASHDDRPDLKTKFLNDIDKMLGVLINNLIEDEKKNDVEYTILITGDHTTPMLLKDHSCEPVPFCIAKIKSLYKDISNTNLLVDDVESFSEINVGKGLLGRFLGLDAMTIAKNYMNLD